MARLCQLGMFALGLMLLAVTQVAKALDFSVTTWDHEEGLPQDITRAIAQTHDGYLWIGMYVGLARFDGVRFVHLAPSDLPEMGSGAVSLLFEDREGTLWAGIGNGRLIAYRNGAVRTHLVESDAPNSAVAAMAQDSSGTIWLQTLAGRLGRVTAEGVDFVATTGPAPNPHTLGLVVDGGGALWVGTMGGLKVWREGRLITPPSLAEWTGQPVEALTRAADGTLWAFRKRRLRKLRFGKCLAEIEAPSEFSGSAVDLVETLDGGLWLAEEDGKLFCLRPEAGVWQVFTAKDGLRGRNLALCGDREGNLWRGSIGGGLTEIRPQLFTRHELPVPGLDRYAYSVCSDTAGNVWVRLNLWQLAEIKAGTETPQIWQGPATPLETMTLFIDRHNILWAGTRAGYLYRLQKDAFVRELKVDPHASTVNAIFEDREFNLWVGFSGGAGIGVMPEGDPGRWHVIQGIPFPQVTAITQASDGAMWFGTYYGGAARFKDGHWTRYTTREGLPSDYVRCLHADTDGTIWLGTMSGLCRWRDGKFTTIKKDSGLWNDSLAFITQDSRGNLWMSSFDGVFRAARTALNDFADGRSPFVRCVGYDRKDGLPSLECPAGFQPAGTRTPDGRLWFPTAGGLVSIDPGKILENKLPPPVWIEEMAVNGMPCPVQPSTSEIKIPPGKRHLEFRFTALSLSAPEKVRFRYKLEGLDPDWSPVNASRRALYYYVPPGRYSFHVIACNNDAVWNLEGNSVHFTVLPFFWQTAWFRGGTVLAIGVGLIWSVRYVERRRFRLRMERLKQEHAVQAERTRIARDIHDELGTNLTQIVSLCDRVKIVRETSPNPAEAERWMQLIPAIARRTVQSLDEIVWAINPKHDTLESFANYLSQFAQEHMTLGGVACMLEVPTVLPTAQLSTAVRHNLLLAAREAVQNVVAHARATQACVALQLCGTTLEISIVDNGCGFNPEQVKGNGDGLQNMRQRLHDIGGGLEVKSQPGYGTTVRLWFSNVQLNPERATTRYTNV